MDNIDRQETVGRTFWDIVYKTRWYLAAIALIIVLRLLGVPLPAGWLAIILPAALLGLVLGLLKGYLQEVPLPPPTIILQPLGSSSARVFMVYHIDSLILPEDAGMPLGTPYGATLRLADEVRVIGGKLHVTPSSLHRLALENPLEALAHIRSLSKISEQLDEAIARYVELYVSTRAAARQLARRRVSELLQLEKQAEKAAKEELKKSLEGNRQ